MDTLGLVHKLFAAIKDADIARLDELYAPNAVQIEHPNRLLASGATRNKAQILEAASRGRAHGRADAGHYPCCRSGKSCGA